MRIATIVIAIILLVSCSGEGEWIVLETGIIDDIHDIELINDNVSLVYTYGTGKLYKSKDGGLDWNLIYQFDSVYFEQIQFVDDKVGWIAGSPNMLFRTEDGGKSWIDIAPKMEKDNALIYGMCFDDSTVGYIAVINYDSDGSKTNIYRTGDSGESWVLVNSLKESILNLELFDGILYGSGNNVIIKKIDSSQEWSYSFHDTTKAVGQIRDIEMKRKKELVAVSFNGYVLKWDGNEWVTSRITSNRIRSMYTSRHKWYAAGDSKKEPSNLYSKEDGAENWEFSEEVYPDIHRLNRYDRRIWAVGKNGLVMIKDL